MQSLRVSVARCSVHTCLEGRACGPLLEYPSAGGELQELCPLGLWRRFCIRCAPCWRQDQSFCQAAARAMV